MPAPGDQHRAGPQNAVFQATDTTNPFEPPQNRVSVYTAHEIAALQTRLDKKLGPEFISSRPGVAGQKVHYLSADKCINLANDVFGFNGWSSSIQNIQIDFVEESQSAGKISLGLSVIVRVTLKDGTYHEDIGYGHIENCKGKALAFEKAKKEGTTDALKRALRNFGNVLGNCIYDKDYLSKVTKVKSNPARWDIADLHRHPDFFPIKKEPPKESEDDDLPPHDPTKHSSSAENTATFDADGEFGSDLFDEADFGVSESGNPDEISLAQHLNNKQKPMPGKQLAGSGEQGNQFTAQDRQNQAMVIPSKSDRSSTGVPAARLQNQTPRAQLSAPDVRQITTGVLAKSLSQSLAKPAPPPQQNLQHMEAPQIQSRTGQAPVVEGPGAQGISKQVSDLNTGEHKIPGNLPPEMLPPGSSPSTTGFYSARAVDILRDNPQAAQSGAPQFDLHAESPSIRKTAGVDHTKSVPISKPMLANVSHTPNSHDFINPSADMHRKIGAPSNVGLGTPGNRGPTISSYRPLTRPVFDAKSAANRPGPGAHNPNGKRPPLSDLTNANAAPGATGISGASNSDPKRVRFDVGIPNTGAPQLEQNQTPYPRSYLQQP